MSKKNVSVLHLEFPRDRKDIAEKIAAIYGLSSPTALITEVFEGKWLLRSNAEPIDFERLYTVFDRFGALEEAETTFRVGYRHSSNNEPRDYHAHFGKIVVHEKRLYLDAWVEEKDDLQASAIAHNRSFRLDRVESLTPTEGEWRNGLDTLDVQFELRGALVRRQCRADEQWQRVGESLIVIRPITSAFWFLREILPYGAECVVLEPEEVRSQVKELFEQGLKNYE